MALDRRHLKAVSDSASLRVVSKLFQKLELKLTNDPSGPSILWLWICDFHFFPYTGCKQSQFYSLPFWQSVAGMH